MAPRYGTSTGCQGIFGPRGSEEGQLMTVAPGADVFEFPVFEPEITDEARGPHIISPFLNPDDFLDEQWRPISFNLPIGIRIPVIIPLNAFFYPGLNVRGLPAFKDDIGFGVTNGYDLAAASEPVGRDAAGADE